MSDQQPIRTVYATVDGVRRVRTFKTLAGARRYAHEWLGAHPEIGTSYAVSGDGIATMTVRGVTLEELFPPFGVQQQPQPRRAEDIEP